MKRGDSIQIQHPARTNTLPTDTTATDSVAAASADSVAAPIPGEVKMGILLEDPAAEYVRQNTVVAEPKGWDLMSWMYLAVALLFCAIGLKFKGNAKYIRSLIADLTDIRMRHNAFDETVKETLLLVMINIMWVICAGIILWVSLTNSPLSWTVDSTRMLENKALGILLCIAATTAYSAIMMLAYWMVGSVFSDRDHTRLWVKGAAASLGLQALALFPLAMLMMSFPDWNSVVLIISIVIFIFGKIVFLIQGFRIFFTQVSSWLLFLYYLCSLEIVPIILTYVMANLMCVRIL
ncbi:MAG: DUF4271 domain-containing protein [Lepagella sp.]